MKNVFSCLGILMTVCIFSCKKGDSTPTNTTRDTTVYAPDTTTLKGVSPFKIGAAIDPFKLQTDAAYRKVLMEQENSITIENAVKWPTIHPTENSFDFTGGDYIADFCRLNDKRLHGHCLIWYSSNPAWLTNFVGDSLAWESLFKTHIQTVVAHYRGKAKSWDVVNEAFRDEDGTLRVLDRFPNDNFDDGCIWARHLGTDYIARAFKYAHEADPAALLFYNEYGQEWKDAKTVAIVNMVNDFRARGIPIHGIGLQMHTNINSSNAGITMAFQKLAATGLQIHISELDVQVNPSNNQSALYTADLQTRQSDKYAFIATEYKRLIPTSQQYGITTWNVGDKDSWIRSYLMYKDWPLFFDDNYERKTCFYVFRNAIKN
jgi:endo-1,4-beta-xylanase